MTEVINYKQLPRDGEKQDKGANRDPNTWRVVPMVNNPLKFKIVDDNTPPINVAHMFDSEASAQQFIDHYMWIESHPCPSGQTHDLETGICMTIPQSSYMAQNNVLQIYSNSSRIPIWVMGFGNWQQRVSRGGSHDGSSSGQGADTVCEERNQVRFNVKCKPNSGEGSGNHKVNLQRGWSDSPDDFVNIEQTGYIDVVHLASQSGNQDVTWYGPSGRHTGSGGSQGCKGSSYKGSLHAKNGTNRMGKENWHVNMTYGKWDWKDGANGVKDIVKKMNGQNKRVGFKWVNFKVGNYRRLEIWVDVGGAIGYNEPPKNQWQLIRVHEDHSDFGEGLDDCGCDNAQQAILWGAPDCTYRWDDTTAKLSLATVQEINTPATFYKEGDKVTSGS